MKELERENHPVQEGKIIIQNMKRGKTTRVYTVTPESLPLRYTRDEKVRDFLEITKVRPTTLFAIVANSRSVLRVIPLSVSGAFKPPMESSSI